MSEMFLNGKLTLHSGDSREVLKSMPDNFIDSIVCDPPYALVSITKRFGKAGAAAVKVPEGGSGAYARASSGFMGKQWDTGETAFAPEFWAQCLRVLKPGGHVVAFSGTRTVHRMVCAIEDAGFEIRDMLSWLYGSGFPKSHNAGEGWGTALKPACEPIVLARKPLSEPTVAANVLRWRTGALNIDGCRIGTEDNLNGGAYSGGSKVLADATSYATGVNAGPFVQPTGRWPANVLHDGSDEVVGAFPNTHGAGAARKGSSDPRQQEWSENVANAPAKRSTGDMHRFGDAGGSAARFFYSAKANGDDRIGSKHPTVKPVDLMQWLCRLVTPKGGTILDPFAGTGTTGEAAWREGFNAVLIEREEEYQADIRRRMALCMAGPEERSRESIKAKLKDRPIDAGPLFGGLDKRTIGPTGLRR